MSLVNKYIDSASFLTATAVYDDVHLTIKAADGYYQFGGQYRRQLSGLLLTVEVCLSCPPTEVFYISLMKNICTDFCDGTNYTIPSPKSTTNNHNYSSVTIQDIIYGAALTDGFYAYAATSTDTATGVYRIMELLNNEIVSLEQCSGVNCVAL